MYCCIFIVSAIRTFIYLVDIDFLPILTKNQNIEWYWCELCYGFLLLHKDAYHDSVTYSELSFRCIAILK